MASCISPTGSNAMASQRVKSSPDPLVSMDASSAPMDMSHDLFSDALFGRAGGSNVARDRCR